MDVFELHQDLITDYDRYTRSFLNISDPRIQAHVDHAFRGGLLWPEPLLQLNPTFQPGDHIDALVKEGVLHQQCEGIFRTDKSLSDPIGKPLRLHTHQVKAIRLARQDQSYVLTSGTGSGKSLAYIVPMVDHVLRHGSGRGIQAIVVYPMNALANSQAEELRKFLEFGFESGKSPVTFGRYTGQERGQDRDRMRAEPPDILLTNYMMLELMLTRAEDRELVRRAQNLKFLAFDELHTYRGRQGADIALLIRRARLAFQAKELVHVGTSATMMSTGSTRDQRREVARFATLLFGVPFSTDQIVGETLKRATPALNFGDPEVCRHLSEVVAREQEPPDDPVDFAAHPLSSWIESTLGVKEEEGAGQLVRQMPRPLQGPDGVSLQLARQTGIEPETGARLLRRFLMKGSALRQNPADRFPIFAFRLHQFLTRADTVWTTLEPEDERHLAFAKLGSKPGDSDKPLFPLAFCRHCGMEYYRVYFVRDGDGQPTVIPRDDQRDELDEEEFEKAYLYVSSESPWPQALTGAAVLDRIPDVMKETGEDGRERVKSSELSHLPAPVFVDSSGRLVSQTAGLPAALIRRNFIFCLNPKCGVAYTRRPLSERAKLATLGVDNRSTATTILAVRTLIALKRSTLQPEARKLLSFTDDRQDASLQAGHFNDFAQVALLRSALHKAVSQHGDTGLTHAELSRAVFEALNLPFDEYAADPDVKGVARVSTNDALRRVIEYYLYRDLQRGWRVTAPNLEDCGLLRFQYAGLEGPDGLLCDGEIWSGGLTVRGERQIPETLFTPGPLARCTPEVRKKILCALLDLLRRELAIKVDVLDQQRQRDLLDQTMPRLQDETVWSLEEGELVWANIAFVGPRPGDRNGFYISSFGRYGQYLRRTLQAFVLPDEDFGRTEVDGVIRFLLEALRRYGIVEQVRGGELAGYQINPAALHWMAGEGLMRPHDPTRFLEAGEIPLKVNQYFLQCYRDFSDIKVRLEAREHTAQVTHEERQEREDRFRSGDLPLMFCSPTMELGVDISQLNVVNLRNVPPTAANYAQRSGRAGRGGQPALVYTYCAGRSPHDQYYFRRPAQMVAGATVPPRIDLRNRDLVRAHVHAIWLETAKPDLGKTLVQVLDLNVHEDGNPIRLPLKPALETSLRDPAHRAAALDRAQQFMNGLAPELASASWYHPRWLEGVFDQLERSFDEACDRWRQLYRAAVRQRELHHRIITEHSRPDADRLQSRRLRAQAESQINLLTEPKGVFEGDFYSYRYFAGEGFLPGYNFPRLPLSAFVPARRRRKGRDEFLSRPRFLAISEFGPQNLIYHEGARYRVYKANLHFESRNDEARREVATSLLKRCPECGYAHPQEELTLSEICAHCGAPLEANSVISRLMRLQSVSVRLAKRITCDEEERQRFGYRFVFAYRFSDMGGRLDRRYANVVSESGRLMTLTYGDATTLYRINLGWAQQRRGDIGFRLDVRDRILGLPSSRLGCRHAR